MENEKRSKLSHFFVLEIMLERLLRKKTFSFHLQRVLQYLGFLS